VRKLGKTGNKGFFFLVRSQHFFGQRLKFATKRPAGFAGERRASGGALGLGTRSADVENEDVKGLLNEAKAFHAKGASRALWC